MEGEPGKSGRKAIGFIGFGTVLGRGAAVLLQSMGEQSPYYIKTIAVRNPDKYRDLYPHINPSIFTTDVNAVIDDPDIVIAVEAIGGVDKPAYYMKQAMKAGKHVVSANKDAIATHSEALFKAAKDHQVNFRFEAAVAGGVHVLDPLIKAAKHHKVGEISGILNGTSNYILTQMASNSSPFEHALRAAQESGFAEADPHNDISGKDSAYKLALLTMLAHQCYISMDDVTLEGIDQVSAPTMEEALNKKETIKLIARSTPKAGGGFYLNVSPERIPRHHPLYGIDNEYNLILVELDGQLKSFGPAPGAGAIPTGKSILNDILMVELESMVF